MNELKLGTTNIPNSVVLDRAELRQMCAQFAPLVEKYCQPAAAIANVHLQQCQQYFRVN